MEVTGISSYLIAGLNETIYILRRELGIYRHISETLKVCFQTTAIK